MSTIPIARPWVGAEEEAAAIEVLRSGWLTQGPYVARFESEFARYVGAAHAVAVTSCTTALHLTMLALGIGAGDEVVVPSLSFIASANALVHAGAQPVFADVDERSFNLTAATVERALTPRCKAILAVHQIGLPADLAELDALARARGLLLVEDAACAIGSSYRGVRIGRPHSRAACFSFHPRKILTCGEGGMITTDDAELAAHLRRLRHHGMSLSDLDRHQAKGRYVQESYGEVGYNYRMTDLQAAVGVAQLGRLDEVLTRRRVLAERYDRALALVDGVEPPHVPADRVTNYQSYMVRLPGVSRARRDAIVDRMLGDGVTTRPGIMAAHRQPPYVQLRAELPATERVSDQTLILPLYHQLTEADQERVVSSLARALST
jgi:dTDP-4-amino-4,6-dideoxygalactose transaminase